MRSLYTLHLSLSVAIPAIQPRLRLSKRLTAFAPLSMVVMHMFLHGNGRIASAIGVLFMIFRHDFLEAA
ncbi:MAG: hypothetical protein KZQ60_16375 [Candidatus Thiodiazotropha sp. (ex Lucinoma aequizonata)]|nr:hypothetical protein [Candidatus Thiodiazotropha sp. (ex Lucinoma aequizonata)]MCU7912908.1 hypothetical protein [Candidatus Thiodiazotropha sp. (ex Lucinoma aequizonata)]